MTSPVRLEVIGWRNMMLICRSSESFSCYMEGRPLHMSELFDAFNPVQLLIMPMMFVLALLMAFDSVKVCKEK